MARVKRYRPSRPLRNKFYMQYFRGGAQHLDYGLYEAGQSAAARTAKRLASKERSRVAGELRKAKDWVYYTKAAGFRGDAVPERSYILGFRDARKGTNIIAPKAPSPSGRNVGTFAHRKGSWRKGKGGRFVGSGG